MENGNLASRNRPKSKLYEIILCNLKDCDEHIFVDLFLKIAQKPYILFDFYRFQQEIDNN